MKINFLLAVAVVVQFVITSSSFAGIGDNAGPFESKATENSNAATNSNSSTFNGGSIFSSSIGQNEEKIMGPPPHSTPVVPLDTNVVLLIIIGAGVGFAKIFKHRVNVFSQQ